MAESAQGGEKTEEATPRRRSQARDEGQVAFSAEVNTALLLVIGLVGIGLGTPWLFAAAATSLRDALGDGLARDLSIHSAIQAMAALAAPFALPTALLIGIAFLAGIIASVAQVGLHLSSKALIPKFQRVNPLTGFGRLFGKRALARFAVNLCKLIFIVLVAWTVVHGDIPRLGHYEMDVARRTAGDAALVWWLGIKLAAVLLIIAAADLVYQRWQHGQDLMMTKQEVKEEMKQSEGDPLVKAKVRQIQRQMAQRRMMQEVPKADVVITNPTHVAVALRYEAGGMDAPVVLAKGYDEVAQRIKAIAAEHNIPMVENVQLARALAREVQIGQAIKPKWFKPVAEILAAVYRLRKGAA